LTENTCGPAYRVCTEWNFNIRCSSNPAPVTRYMDIVVARWNNTTGLSARAEADKELKKRLPKHFGLSALEVFGRVLGDVKAKG
jgi:hypothetical protein